MTTQSMTLPSGLATRPSPEPRPLTFAHLREWCRMMLAEFLCFTCGCGPK